MLNLPRIVFGGDRQIAVRVLKFLLKKNVLPFAILVSQTKNASHAAELRRLCDFLDDNHVLNGDEFRTQDGIKLLKEAQPDFIICVHFPYIFPKEVLSVPKYGVLNLHPAFLPWNRGWHTPVWAIWEQTPYGATLHFMSEEIDGGDVVHQKRLRIRADDTADSLYQRVMKLEYDVFREVWPSLVDKTYLRKPQNLAGGSFHRKEDIKSIQFLDLNATSSAEEVIRRVRALTTNNVDEAAYFKCDGTIYRMQIEFNKEQGIG